MKRQLPIDFFYPGLFAVAYTLMLVWLFGKRFDGKSKIFLLGLIPALAGLFDYWEIDACWMAVAEGYPTKALTPDGLFDIVMLLKNMTL